jgi:lysozyme family protein
VYSLTIVLKSEKIAYQCKKKQAAHNLPKRSSCMSDYQTQSTQTQSQDYESSTETTSFQSQDTIGNSAVQEGMQSRQPPSGLRQSYDEVFLSNQERVGHMQVGLSESQMSEMSVFIDNWERNKTRYQAVSALTNMPAELIAAIHWREGSGNFNTYLHQGDPLGRPAVNWPSNIPVFHVWEDAAVHALNMKDSLREQLEIDAATQDATVLATYAEAYNGLGYHYKDKASPYVFSGTSEYSSGKYVADGIYRASTVDQQLGVMPMLGAIGGLSTPQDMSPRLIDHDFAWAKVLNGSRVLRQGDYGMEVEALQAKLAQLGYEVGQDGDFGPGTKRVVKQFQTDQELASDGIVGGGTAERIESLLSQQAPTENASAGSATVE